MSSRYILLHLWSALTCTDNFFHKRPETVLRIKDSIHIHFIRLPFLALHLFAFGASVTAFVQAQAGAPIQKRMALCLRAVYHFLGFYATCVCLYGGMGGYFVNIVSFFHVVNFQCFEDVFVVK